VRRVVGEVAVSVVLSLVSRKLELFAASANGVWVFRTVCVEESKDPKTNFSSAPLNVEREGSDESSNPSVPSEISTVVAIERVSAESLSSQTANIIQYSPEEER
jgi:hypothetical protein